MTQYEDLVGQTFGEWKVLSYAGSKPTRFLCSCSCGTEREVAAGNLKKGASTNCGCKRQYRVTHGQSRRGEKTRTYRQWKAMWSRCKPEHRDARNYFERGIRVCDRWKSFEAFFSDMGECPDGLTLDRTDNDKGYAPGNCRWADMRTQRRNQRRVCWVTFDGERMTLQDAAERIGVHPSAIWNDRRRSGVTIHEALVRVAARRGKAKF